MLLFSSLMQPYVPNYAKGQVYPLLSVFLIRFYKIGNYIF